MIKKSTHKFSILLKVYFHSVSATWKYEETKRSELDWGIFDKECQSCAYLLIIGRKLR